MLEGVAAVAELARGVVLDLFKCQFGHLLDFFLVVLDVVELGWVRR